MPAVKRNVVEESTMRTIYFAQFRVELQCDNDVEAVRLAKQLATHRDVQAHGRAGNTEAIDYC